jgi:hypothetical protein
MTLELWGATAFGVVVGWITYRTLRRTKASGLGDLVTVIGAVGGAAVTSLFPAGSEAFGCYGIGLAAGFFFYLLVSLLIARRTANWSAVEEWLGEPMSHGSGQVPGGKAPALDRPTIPND